MMGYEYTQASRASNAHALPDCEVFHAARYVCSVCGCEALDEQPPCAHYDPERGSGEEGWFYAFGAPGCLWDSAPSGPYASREAALAAAREAVGVCPHGVIDDEPCDECDGGTPNE